MSQQVVGGLQPPSEEEQSRASLAARFPEIANAWQLKEALRSWYATASAATAAAELDDWMAAVKAKEANPKLRVLLLEKANVKRSGAISMGMDGLNNAVVPGFAVYRT